MVATAKRIKSSSPVIASAVAAAEPVMLPGDRMAFTVDHREFKRALATLSRVADARSPMKILGMVAMRAGASETQLLATDLNLSATYTFQPLGRSRGGHMAPAKALAQCIGKLPAGEITIAANARGVSIVRGSAELTVDGMSDRDFPKVPTRKPETHMATVDAEAFVALLKGTGYASCKDETRFHLCGTFLESDGVTLRAVATDGHRLVRATDAISGIQLPKGIILPSKAAAELARTLTKGPVRIGQEGMHLFVEQGPWTFACKLIDAVFPAYGQVIPTTNAKLITVDREALIGAMERAALLASATRRARLSCGDFGVLLIQSDNPDGGETTERLPAEYHGSSGTKIGLNPRYLIDTLRNLTGERVTLAMGAELDPIVVRDTEDVVSTSLASSAYVAVIMPMRLS